MKKILFTVVIAGILFACNRQDITDPVDIKGESSVTLTVKQIPQTKSVSPQKGNSEYAVIGSGELFFIDASGNNIYERELTTAEIAALTNTESTPGNKKVTITGIPNTATTLFFLANVLTTATPDFPAVSGTTKADARLRIDQLQADAIHVPMSGQSTTFVSSGEVNKYTADVTLTPLVARVEIGQVTCQNQDGAGQPAVNADITSYKLSGVFINNVRPSVLLDGTPYLVGAPIDIKNQTGWAMNWENYFMSFNSHFPYYIGGDPAGPNDWVANAMVDYCTPPLSGLTFYPEPSNGAVNTDPGVTPKRAWAYQVVPSTLATIQAAVDIPHVILKLTEVKYLDNPYGLPIRYVTVTKYKDSSNNPVLEFKRGNIYRIENLVFTHNDATNQPYEKNITVTATVSVAPWVVNTITPDWE